MRRLLDLPKLAEWQSGRVSVAYDFAWDRGCCLHGWVKSNHNSSTPYWHHSRSGLLRDICLLAVAAATTGELMLGSGGGTRHRNELLSKLEYERFPFRAYDLRLATANGWFYGVPPPERLSESWRGPSYRRIISKWNTTWHAKVSLHPHATS